MRDYSKGYKPKEFSEDDPCFAYIDFSKRIPPWTPYMLRGTPAWDARERAREASGRNLLSYGTIEPGHGMGEK